MEIKICPRNHRYDPSVYPSCPVCASEGNRNGSFDFGATAPDFPTMDFGNDAFGDVGSTQPVGGFDDFGKTIPAGGPDPVAGFGAPQPMGFGDFGSDFKTAPLPGAGSMGGQPGGMGGQAGGMEEYGATVPVGVLGGQPGAAAAPQNNNFYGAMTMENYGATTPMQAMNYGAATQAAIQAGQAPSLPNGMPVVGWLVAIEGPARGMDFRMSPNWNTIGRSRHNDIMVPGDEHISREGAARVGYISRTRKYYFAAGADARNMVELNDCVVVNAVEMHDRDIIRIGDTKLMFIALCGEEFNWDE